MACGKSSKPASAAWTRTAGICGMLSTSGSPSWKNRLERRRREFLEDLSSVQTLVEQRLADLDKSIKLAADELAKMPDRTEAERARLDSETTRRLAAEREFVMGQIDLARAETQRTGDVAQEKFAAIDGLFNSNDKALTAALAAQEKAAAEQQKSNTLAIDKSEKTTIETIRANDDKTASAIKAQSDTIADLKDRVVRIEATGAGATSVTGSPFDAASYRQYERSMDQQAEIARSAQARAIMALVISGVLLVISLASVIFAVTKK